MTGKKKTVEPEAVDEAPVDEPTVVVHDYDPVRPHARRRNDPDDSPEWVEQEHPEVDE